MKIRNRTVAMLVGVMLASVVNGQESLTLDQAIAKALDQNLNIQVAQKQREMAANNVSRGNAGLTPTVSASASAQYGNNNTLLEIVNQPQPIETSGAESVNYNAALNVSYTVFSGLGNLRTYDKLQIQSDLSDAQSRLQVETVLMQVANAYFNLLRAQNNLELLNESLAISERRRADAQVRFEVSGDSRLNLLNAQVDLNQDSVNYLNAQRAAEQASIMFNRLLGLELRTEWQLDHQWQVAQIQDIKTLEQALENQNSAMKAARLNEQASLLDFQIVKSAYLPTLNLSGSYAYARSENEGSFLSVNETTGLTAGLTLSVPIYTGGKRQIRSKNAQVAMDVKKLELEDQQIALKQELLNAFQSFETARKVVALEKRNVAVAEENFSYSQEQFNNAQISSLQFRQAQLNLLLVKNSLNNAIYNARLAEVEVMRLTGSLVKADQ